MFKIVTPFFAAFVCCIFAIPTSAFVQDLETAIRSKHKTLSGKPTVIAPKNRMRTGKTDIKTNENRKRPSAVKIAPQKSKQRSPVIYRSNRIDPALTKLAAEARTQARTRRYRPTFGSSTFGPTTGNRPVNQRASNAKQARTIHPSNTQRQIKNVIIKSPFAKFNDKVAVPSSQPDFEKKIASPISTSREEKVTQSYQSPLEGSSQPRKILNPFAPIMMGIQDSVRPTEMKNKIDAEVEQPVEIQPNGKQTGPVRKVQLDNLKIDEHLTEDKPVELNANEPRQREAEKLENDELEYGKLEPVGNNGAEAMVDDPFVD